MCERCGVLISCSNVAVAFWLQLPRLQELLVCRAGEQNSVITLQQGPAATTLQGPWGGGRGVVPDYGGCVPEAV